MSKDIMVDNLQITEIAVCKFLRGLAVVWPETYLFCPLYAFIKRKKEKEQKDYYFFSAHCVLELARDHAPQKCLLSLLRHHCPGFRKNVEV